LLGNGSVKKDYGANEYTHNNKRIVEGVVFYAVGVVSKKVGDYLLPGLLVSLFSSFPFVSLNIYWAYIKDISNITSRTYEMSGELFFRRIEIVLFVAL
jgi:hypothetical protein